MRSGHLGVLLFGSVAAVLDGAGVGSVPAIGELGYGADRVPFAVVDVDVAQLEGCSPAPAPNVGRILPAPIWI